MKKTAIHVFLGLLIAAGLLLMFWVMAIRWPLPGPQPPDPTQQPGVGHALAALDLAPLTGDSKSESLPELRGKVILLNFWGTWCPPCRDELPYIAAIRDRYAGQPSFRLLAVSCPREDADVDLLRDNTRTLLQRFNLDLPTYHDPNSITRRAVDAVVGFDGYFPLTVLLDRQGVIRAVWLGVANDIEPYIDQVLADPK